MKKIENQKELEDDLLKKFDSYGSFNCKLFKKDFPYGRRSFKDLFKYYRLRGVSELQLMKAIKTLKLVARYCYTPNNIVFFKEGTPRGRRFWWSVHYESTYYRMLETPNLNKCGKYTGKYLEELYDKV